MRVGDPGFGEMVEIIRTTTGVGDDGYPVEGSEKTWTVSGCAVAPLKIGEDASPDGNAILDGFTVYMPLGTDITGEDSMRVRGGLYRVDGEPGAWVNPYSPSNPCGIEVVVRGA